MYPRPSAGEPADAAEGPIGPPSWAEAAGDKLDEMRLTGDRVLLAIIQTSLSLIGFGFTIYQIFSDAAQRAGLPGSNRIAGRLGLSLLILGLMLLVTGLWGHAHYNRTLNARRAQLARRGLVAPWRVKRISPIFVIALLLLAVSVTTLVTIVLRRL